MFCVLANDSVSEEFPSLKRDLETIYIEGPPNGLERAAIMIGVYATENGCRLVIPPCQCKR